MAGRAVPTQVGVVSTLKTDGKTRQCTGCRLRAQEVARTLPSVEGPTVSIEDITDNTEFKKTMREIFKEAGIAKDFGG